MSKPSLKKFSVKQLEQEISRRKILELEQEKSKIEEEIKVLSGTEELTTTVVPNKISKKIKKFMKKDKVVNDKSLKSQLISIGSDYNVHTTNEFLTVLENSGWKTTSPKPYYVVAAALASLEKKNIFRRITKGSYVLNRNEVTIH